MSSALAKTGLFVLAALSSMSLIANQVTVMAQEGIAPVNSGLAGGSQSSQSVVVVTITGDPDSGLDPSGFVPTSIQSSSSASAITVTASAATVTASAVTVTASATTASAVTVTASADTVTASASTVTASASTVTTSVDLAAQLYSLPAEQAVITQAPCVSACLQAAVIASAAGPCGRTAGVAIDNGCGCLSAPLNALQALTNCASAACIGRAAGTMDPASGSVVVSSLYNAYCLTAVNAALFSAATATSSDAASQTTTSEPNTASVGSMIPGFTSGNSTFNGVITPTVTTTTSIVTANAPAPTATTTVGGDPGGNNTGGHSGAGRGVSDKLTM